MKNPFSFAGINTLHQKSEIFLLSRKKAKKCILINNLQLFSFIELLKVALNKVTETLIISVKLVASGFLK